MEHQKALDAAGLTKNEARVYAALVEQGELTVSEMAQFSGAHRRNVYDTVIKLIEKGLVFEIIGTHEKRYQAVDPQKLLELVEEKRSAVQVGLPALEHMFRTKAPTERVALYRGFEGWKNYMRDVVRVGADTYTIGGKGSWADERLGSFSAMIHTEAKRKNMHFHMLFDHGLRNTRYSQELMTGLNIECRFLPSTFSSAVCADIFGPYVVLLQDQELGYFNEETALIVIENEALADGFRKWFHGLWEIAEP